MLPLVLWLGCSGGDVPDKDDESTGLFPETGETDLDMDGCRAWLSDQHDPSPPMGCTSGELDWRAEMLSVGATVFPVGDSRYAVIWLPESWAQGDPLLYVVHNSDGCGEQLLSFWDSVRGDRSLGFVAISYRSQGAADYDTEPVIYDNLTGVHTELSAHCPVAASAKVYYGFSRGAGRGYGISFLDRSAEVPYLDGYILDSGTTRPNPNDTERGVLDGASYWLWCGGRDPDPINSSALLCDTMAGSLVPFLEEYGGSVQLTEDPDGCHGMFFDCGDTCGDCRLRRDGADGDFPSVFDFISDL